MTTTPPRGGRVEALIRATYDQLADVPGQPVRIRVLREAIARTPDPPHPLMVDKILDVMSLQPGVHIRASVDQQHLTAADREHGVLLGGQWRHNIQIETPDAPGVSDTPPPAPDLPQAAPRRAGGRSQQPAPRSAGVAGVAGVAGASSPVAGDAGGSGETLDADAAAAFCRQVRRVAEDLHTSLETSVTTLRGRGVSGPPITLLERMQDTTLALLGDAEDAQAHFERHVALADQLTADDTLAGVLQDTYLGASGAVGAGSTARPAATTPTSSTGTGTGTGARGGAGGGVDAVAEAVPTLWPDDPKSATARILTAYQRLSHDQPGTWIGLAAIRDTFDMPDDEIQAAFERLIASPGCHVVEAPDLRSLTQADHDAAVWCAGTWRHMMMIDQPLRRR